jgi:C_GCAxxG_C_C family probable redox protein
MSKADKAKELFEGGCNCCQAVFCAFLEETNLTEDEALRLSAGFGGGLGRMREVCGAVSGMSMIAGFLSPSPSNNDPEAKRRNYALVQHLAEEFRSQNGSIVCRTLLGLECSKESPEPSPRTEEYYKKRPCAELVGDAARIIANYINNSKE